jgi:hypothetical protein
MNNASIFAGFGALAKVPGLRYMEECTPSREAQRTCFNIWPLIRY